MAAEITCCPHPKEQQLYMLELLVDRLNLTPEKIQEIGSTPLSVRLEFLDFPTFEISEEEFWSATKRKEKQSTLSTERTNTDGSLDFSAGKSCLFPKKPNELIEAMHSQPMKIAVYKVEPKNIWGPPKERAPICTSEVPLSGCLCDQVAMSENDSSHLPKPYTLRDTRNLIDDQGAPSGTIHLSLRLTCLGKLVVTQFAVQEKSFLFKSSDSPNEFQCGRVPLDKEEAATRADEILDSICVPEGHVNLEVNPAPQARNVIGLAPICQELAKRDGGPLEIVPTLKLSTHRVVEDNRAPKINPDEVPCMQKPICAEQGDCSIQNEVPNEFPCGRGFCSGGLCAGPRIIDLHPAPHREAMNHFPTNCCCSSQNSSSQRMQNYCYNPRMRGGGRWDDELQKGDDPCSKYSSRVPVQSVETLLTGACKSVKSVEGSKPGCCCYGKLGTGIMPPKSITNNGFCSNKPCLGVDCLIRAFKETQDFVDSIGKVPGLAGLGLMDPAESPFFGREREDAVNTCAEKRGALGSSLGKQTSSIHHPGLRNQLPPKRASDGKTINTILPAPGTGHAMPPHREANAIHSDTMPLSSGKSKKKTEDKTEKHKELQESSSHQTAAVGETAPCGVSRCKSRKNKLKETISGDASKGKMQVAAKQFPVQNRLMNSRRTRLQGKTKSFSNVGSNGSRASAHRHSYIKVSRRIMRLVNAIRDPIFCYGHKNCLDVRLRVPGNMGWLWNSREIPTKLKPPIGWKPGAISKFVWDRMQQAKSVCPGSTTSESRASIASGKGKRGKGLRGIRSFHSASRSPWARSKLHEDDNEVELPPSLHIHRKNGTYYITMYPVKAENINEPELQEQVKPLQFKVTKNREEGATSSSSSASDMEIEFSPPAAINRFKKKEPGVDRDTQVCQQEILDTFKPPAAENPPDKKAKKKNKK